MSIIVSMSLDLAECDRARLARDPSYDGRFYTGVHTTGIYCRPVCPVRPTHPGTNADWRKTTRRSHSLAIGRAAGVDPNRSFARVGEPGGPFPVADIERVPTGVYN